MATKGIIFSDAMVCALLEGRKTQTRRLLNGVPDWATSVSEVFRPQGLWQWSEPEQSPLRPLRRWPSGHALKAPFIPGDRAYVRECWGMNHYEYERGKAPKVRPADLDDTHLSYRATEGDCEIRNELRYRPSIHMPRWASRIWLEVEDVRVERLQSISEADAIAEGLAGVPLEGMDPRGWYRDLWDNLHIADGTRWDHNPWVVAVTFDVQLGNVDQ